jgi:P27 family predicted phage terminase small subunit
VIVPRAAKTEAEHFLDGTKPQTKPVAGSVIKAGRPKFPRYLSPVARAEFKRACALLEQRGHLTPADAGVLFVYSEIFARWVLAKNKLGDELEVSITVLDSSGVAHEKKALNPLLDVVTSCERQLLSLQKSLGLTPGDRDKVKKAAPGGDVITFRPGSVGAMLQAEGKIYGKDF